MFAVSRYCCVLMCFCFKQKTAYEMRISDWSSDVCSSDLDQFAAHRHDFARLATQGNHPTVDWRGNVHHGLVGHDIGQYLVLDHHVANLDVPHRQFNYGDAFADVRHLDNVRAHPYLHDPFPRRPNPGRPWEISPPLRIRVGRVTTRDT